MEDDIQAPVQLVLDRPVAPYRVGGSLYIRQRSQELSGIDGSFPVPGYSRGRHADRTQVGPVLRSRQPGKIGQQAVFSLLDPPMIFEPRDQFGQFPGKVLRACSVSCQRR